MTYRVIRAIEDEEAAKLQTEIIDDEKYEESEHRQIGWYAYEKRERLLNKLTAIAADKSRVLKERKTAAVGAFALCCDPWRPQIGGAQELIMQLMQDASPEPPYPPYEIFRDIRPAFQEIATFIRAGAFKPDEDPNPILVILYKILNDIGPAVQADKVCHGWKEICATIQVPYKQHRRLKRLNAQSNGPIRSAGRAGKKPEVRKGDLLRWWSDIEARVEAQRKVRRDRQIELCNQKPYGRHGRVIASDAHYDQFSVKERKKGQK
ncbi:MAG: hypothetical protein HY716_06825 [Planctomycetes bacterium]|nr:hypothetical protein [Planctomycetota bacterium]